MVEALGKVKNHWPKITILQVLVTQCTYQKHFDLSHHLLHTKKETMLFVLYFTGIVIGLKN